MHDNYEDYSKSRDSLKILYITNYLYFRGGAEVSLFEMANLARKIGCEVIFLGTDYKYDEKKFPNSYLVKATENINNKYIRSILQIFNLYINIPACLKLIKILKQEQVDIVHLNNIHNKISPSILLILKFFKIKVFWSLRDYKIICPNYKLLRNSKVCNLCSTKQYFNCVRYKCINNSYLHSILIYVQTIYTLFLKSYSVVNIYLPTSQFMANKFVEFGFDYKFKVLPNFFSLPINHIEIAEEKYALYFGRLSQEKGVFTMIDAFKGIDLQLLVIGDGPIYKEIENYLSEQQITNVKMLGFCDQEKLYSYLSRCYCVVFPSEWYEPFGRVIIESFALSKPVIGSDLGAIPDLITNYNNGLIFKNGNEKSLHKCIKLILDDNMLYDNLCRNAKYTYQNKFSTDKFSDYLIDLYKDNV